jgi:hypothetical protein
MKKSLEIKPGDVDIEDKGLAKLDSPMLTEGLIKDRERTLGKLEGKVGANFTLDQLSIDSDGKVVIDNMKFRDQLEKMLGKEAAIPAAARETRSNTVCNFWCE